MHLALLAEADRIRRDAYVDAVHRAATGAREAHPGDASARGPWLMKWWAEQPSGGANGPRTWADVALATVNILTWSPNLAAYKADRPAVMFKHAEANAGDLLDFIAHAAFVADVHAEITRLEASK